MDIKTKQNDLMISSFDVSPDDLRVVGVAVGVALSVLKPSPFMPVVVINEFDDFFGNSVNVVYKEQKIELQ